MTYIYHIFRSAARALLLVRLLEVLMLVRAVMSWFPQDAGRARLHQFLCSCSPSRIIMPIRALLSCSPRCGVFR